MPRPELGNPATRPLDRHSMIVAAEQRPETEKLGDDHQ